MRGRLPNDVPTSGERYNFVLDRCGLTKEGQVASVWIIDTGKYKGVRVTAHLDNIDPDDVMRIHKERRHVWRMSAILHVTRFAIVNGIKRKVDADYNDSNVLVTYDLDDAADPTGPSELAQVLKRNALKFRRNL